MIGSLPRAHRALGHALVGLALAFGVYHAIALAWTCDDAFISFRYSRNLADGLGLVYNAGERVEGYTNFAWTVVLAGAMRLGLDPVPTAHVLGVACHVALLLLLLLTARRRGGWSFPLAAVGYALHQQAAEFATSGLETSMFTLLATAALIALVHASTLAHFAGAGTLLVLVAATRPDGLLLAAAGGAVVLAIAVRRRDPRPLLALALPGALLYAPYFAWKWSYYGYPFPNTFYAKSAHDPYFSLGFAYVGFYLAYSFAVIPGLAAPLLLRGHRLAAALDLAGWTTRGPLVIGAFVLPWLAYVAWVGGDFMFGRFCIPVTPALYLGVQLVAERLRPRWRGGAIAFVALASLVTIALAGVIPSTRWSHERAVYPAWYVASYRTIGQRLRETLRGTGARAVVPAMQAMLGYFAAFPVAIEVNGLTDEVLAHRPLAARGPVGHEKATRAFDDYFVERGMHFVFGVLDFVRPPPGDRIGDSRYVAFFVPGIPFPAALVPGGRTPVDWWVRATLITYDRELMATLAVRADVQCQRFEDYLDRYLADLPRRDPAEVAADFADFRRFYFDHNEDPERRAAFEGFLLAAPR